MATRTSKAKGAQPLIDPDDTDALEAGRALISRYLDELHAIEVALVTTLQAHVAMTPPGSYRRLLERHLGETRQHAEAIERRRAEMGEAGGLVDSALGLVDHVVGQVLALSKAPIDLLRGANRAEKLLKNARDECATEALEIAAYDALEHVARAVGDRKTAELATRHRGQEERMLKALRAEIPGLAAVMVRETTA
jgi:ferritin-like metal-binding protein YciE